MLAASSLSALTLGALEFYDPRRLETLMRVYARTSNPQLAARALVGAALLLSKYKSRTDNSRTLKQLAAEAAERPAFQSEMRALVSGMLSTRDTDRISRTITQEIIPDLMKLKPEIEKRFKGIDPEEINEEMPEWMEMIEKSGVEEKLRRFTEMQGEGADVFMAAFSQMKNFPFFNELSNWFLPFSASYSDVHESLQDLPAEWATLVMSMPIFCASDKYSLALSVGRMPAQQAQMMSQQMNAQMSMLDEERKADFQQSLRTSTEAEIGLYLRDLYRFYKLNALRDEFFNPFASTFTLPSGPLFSDLDADEEMLRLMADFYFKHSYWSEAAPLYAIIAASEKADNTDMQKRAYCLEMNGLHSEALEIYRQAEMMEEPDKWLLKRIAALLRATGKPAQAAEYYSRVLEKEPDSLRITMLRGHSLLEAGDVKEALKCYYKVDYLKPDSRRSQRPIAWCEFLLGDYDKAIAKYRKITGLAADDLSHVSADATDSDILNYGHALFASGRIQEAAQVYNLLSMRAGDEKFREMYLSDMKTLREAGLDELTLLLMADAARQQ